MQEEITEKTIEKYRLFLAENELSEGTIDKYLRDIRQFTLWLKQNCPEGQLLKRQNVIHWKESLLERKYAPVTVNSMLSALNSFLSFMKKPECKVQLLRIQKKMFCTKEKELTRNEYEKLLKTAKHKGNNRLFLLMECIGNTGIRVSEVKYITVEAAEKGRVEIFLKGKIRTILIQKKLCRRLLEYAKKNHIQAGGIFLTRNGRELSRKQIWKEMKSLCKLSGVSPKKVFPHNLRHLFAVVYYKASRDIAKLADVLGHSSIDTTRVYLLTSGAEHMRQMEKMCMLI